MGLTSCSPVPGADLTFPKAQERLSLVLDLGVMSGVKVYLLVTVATVAVTAMMVVVTAMMVAVVGVTTGLGVC